MWNSKLTLNILNTYLLSTILYLLYTVYYTISSTERMGLLHRPVGNASVTFWLCSQLYTYLYVLDILFTSYRKRRLVHCWMCLWTSPGSWHCSKGVAIILTFWTFCFSGRGWSFRISSCRCWDASEDASCSARYSRVMSEVVIHSHTTWCGYFRISSLRCLNRHRLVYRYCRWRGEAVPGLQASAGLPCLQSAEL
jgi:hypothetical protein